MSSCVTDVTRKARIYLCEPLFGQEILGNWGQFLLDSHLLAFKLVINGEKTRADEVFQLHVSLLIRESISEVELDIINGEEMLSACFEPKSIFDKFYY